MLAAMLLSVSLISAPDLSTVAEKSDFHKTSHYADVVSFADALAKASPHVKHSNMGKTVEGRDIPLLIISEDGAATSGEVAALAAKGKLVVFLFGNIHAGEVDGKDALQILARDLATGDLQPLLKDLVVLIAPIYNCDGNEKFSPTNRPGQIGPDEMGVRENSHNRDLNRDFIKLEEPETQSLVKLLNNFDPNLVVDCHTTNGSYHRYLITYAGPKTPAGDADLISYSRETWFPALQTSFDTSTEWKSFWYGSFEGAFTDAPRGHTRWETFPAEGRYSTSYIGLRNRLSTLVESYSYSSFKDRVLGSHAFCKNILQLAAKNKDQIKALEREADERAVSKGKTIGDKDEVALRTAAAAWPDKVDILGFEEEIVDGHMKSTGKLKTYNVDLFDRFVTEKAVTRPFGYIIRDEPDLRPIIAKIRDHGIEVRQLAEEAMLPIESLTIIAAKPGSREYQGHTCVQVDAKAHQTELSFNPGTWFIPASQPLGNLACYLLEPESEDGLVTWNYFDQFIPVGAEFPVYRVMEARDIKTSIAP
jgi:dipeptidyl-peptidase-4